jgi:hypothetical protein
MRSLLALFLLAFSALACGKVASEPPPEDQPPAPGGACSDEGATAPAGDGCNTCTCGAEGWSCTLLLCDPPDVECLDGEVKPADDGCNSCTCAEGTWLCSLMPCVEPVCDDGESTSDGCNSCSCEDGSWSCTDVYCPPPCEDGSIKSAGDGCNTCSCEDGAWLCSQQACSEPECPIPDDLPEQDCAGSEFYGRAEGTDACCELCYVLEGYQYYDSMEACEASKACNPGETKYADDQCNTCTCSWDGTWACTSSDCEPAAAWAAASVPRTSTAPTRRTKGAAASATPMPFVDRAPPSARNRTLPCAAAMVRRTRTLA